MPASADRIPLRDSERQIRLGARAIGPIDQRDRLEVTVYVRDNPAAAALPSPDDLAAIPPQERKLPSDEEFFSAFGADPKDLDKVAAFAKAHKLKVEEKSARKGSIRLSGSAAAMQEAFGVQLQYYEYPGGRYRGRTGAVYIPRELEGIIDSVFGLDDRPTGSLPRLRRGTMLPLPSAHIAHTGGLPTGTHFPPELAQLYAYPPGTDGSGQCIGVLAFNESDSHGGYRDDALKTYFEQVLRQPTPSIVDVVVHGQGNDPGDDSGNDPFDTTGEVMLDVCTVGAMAPGAQIAVYFSRFTEQGWVDVLTAIVADTDNRPSVVSISYGNPEDDPRSAWTAAAIRRVNRAFRAAALRNITFLAASGDDGSRDQSGGPRAHADFPASSPYVLGVGGTRLVTQGQLVVGEVAWGNGPGDATGGGISRFFELPTWQRNVGVPPSANPDHRIGRGVPDVAAVADPQTGVAIITVDGQHLAIVGGTSASAPQWASLIARLNQALGAPLGYFNPLLYTRFSAGVLRDIVHGTNGAYHARPGWDACTGLGSPNGIALLHSLQSLGSGSQVVRPLREAYDQFYAALVQAAAGPEQARAAAVAYDRWAALASGAAAAGEGDDVTSAYEDYLAAARDAIAPASFADAAAAAYRSYVQAVRDAWTRIDPLTIDVADLVAIASSLMAGANDAATAVRLIQARNAAAGLQAGTADG